MAFWLELRCDTRNRPGRPAMSCLSHDNDGPMDITDNRGKDVAALAANLLREARANGWKKTADGWICPKCIAYDAGKATD